MNRINPLYAGAFLVVLLLFLSFKLSSSKSELLDAKEAYKESFKLSSELSGLKKVYSKKMNLKSFMSASVTVKNIKNGVILSSKSMSVNELDELMGKVINGAYNITELKVKKLNPTKVSLYLEIKW